MHVYGGFKKLELRMVVVVGDDDDDGGGKAGMREKEN